MIKSKDYMAKQTANLNRMASRSQTAIGTLTNIVDELQAINANIDRTAEEIDTYVADLSATRSDMLTEKSRNQMLLDNLKTMLTLPLAARQETKGREEDIFYGED